MSGAAGLYSMTVLTRIQTGSGSYQLNRSHTGFTKSAGHGYPVVRSRF